MLGINAEELLPGVEWFGNPLEAAEGADLLVVLTEWNEFRALDLKQLRKVMRGDALVDLRNVYQPALAEDAGFTYSSIGRSQKSSQDDAAAKVGTQTRARFSHIRQARGGSSAGPKRHSP